MRIKVNEINSQDVFIDQYTLTKTQDEFGQVIEIDSRAKFEGDDFRSLINKSKNGENRSEAELTIFCGEDQIIKSGYIQHNEGKYNLVSCIAEKSVNFDHPLECIKDRTFNIFDYNATISETVQGTLERISLNLSNYYLDDPQGTYTFEQILSIVSGDLVDRTSEGYYFEYIRIIVDPIWSLPNGSDSAQYEFHDISVIGNYYRLTSPTQIDDNWAPIPGGGGFFLIEQITPEWIGPELFGKSLPDGGIDVIKQWTYGKLNRYTNTTISNTFSVNEILSDLLMCIGYPVVSNFFGINPDGSNPNNSQYQYAANNYQNLRIAQSFDVIRESALQDSFGRSGNIKFKDFIESINAMFNVTIVVDDAAGVTRLEHVTYFERKGLDFVANNIEYELNPEFEMNKELINRENLKIGEPVENPEFHLATIDYRNLPFGQELNEKFIEAELFLTDLFGLLNNEKYNDTRYRNLFFLLQTDGNAVIRQNKGLSAKELIENIHNVNRPYSVGFIEDNFTRFGGFSFGLEGEMKLYSSIKTFDKLLVGNTVKLRQGTFLIKEISINERSLITLKIVK